ncbi:MAG: hypothetical protein GY923_15260 [Aestuariibacter sp.]|nr:hypothetical protein [Aestuariibacter sp.]
MRKRLQLVGVLAVALAVLVAGTVDRVGTNTRATSIAGYQSANTACDGDTDATASLSCVNTGDVPVSGWMQATVCWEYHRSAGAAGTAVKMQCDTKLSRADLLPGTTNATAIDATGIWYHYLTVDSADNSTVRTWSHATTANTNGCWNFGVNAAWLRCKLWITSGNASDLVGAVFVKRAAQGD